MNKRPEKTSLSTGAGEAGEIAIEALAWLAGDEARLERFLSISGLGPQNLRKAASEPSFLAAILDYLASDEALLLQFAGDSGRRPDDVARAHAAFRGPETGAYS
jgi:Protein of unknown function (DUF3572)